jgi:DNA-binding transcriptional ArsR family regulator
MAFSKAPQFFDENDDTHVVAGYGAALSHPVRVRIAEYLAFNGPMYLSEIQEYIGLSQPTVSHHVKKLVHHGILVFRVEGAYVRYWFNDANLPVMAAYLTGFFQRLQRGLGESS